MGILGIGDKYKFDGIGQASATAAFLALAQSQPWLTTGVLGKLTYWFLTRAFSAAASAGLVLLNVGVAKVETLIEATEFDGSFDEAFKIINAKGSSLTKEEADAIDSKVIAAFRKFADMSK